MSSLPGGYGFTLHTTFVVALPEGLLWLPDSKTLVASDLHLEKGSAFAAKGSLLPPFDTSETLNRLDIVMMRLKPDLLIALGDSFHDVRADERLHPTDKSRLLEISLRQQTIWVEGNHDPEVPDWLAGERRAAFCHEALLFTHAPTGQVAGEVAGHLHPCARVAGASGRTIRRRCFVSDGSCLIMPAFGAFTGGLNIRDTAFDGLFTAPPVALIMGGTARAPTKISAVDVRKLEMGH